MCQYNQLFCTVIFLVFIGTTSYFWYDYGQTVPFTVEGVMTAVDSCERHCFTPGVGPVGCVHAISVSLQWDYDDEMFSENNVTADFTKCGSVCCVESVNKTVQVEIDPEYPADALTFWSHDASPFSKTSLFWAVFFLIGTVIVGFDLIVVSLAKKNQITNSNEYQQL